MKYQNSIIILLALIILGLLGALYHFGKEWKREHDNFSSLILEKTEANRNSINFITAGMSLSEQRLRKVLQTEKIIKHYNPTLKSEFINSLAMIIVDISSKYPNLTHLDICAIIAIESRFNPKAQSPVGAKGLMQIMDQTAEFICHRFAWGYVPAISFDPEKNIIMGVFYFNYLMEWNKVDKEVALVNYNGGYTNANLFKILREFDTIPSGFTLPTESREYPVKFFREKAFLEKKFAFIDSDTLTGSDAAKNR